jgi:hypothetical protein
MLILRLTPIPCTEPVQGIFFLKNMAEINLTALKEEYLQVTNQEQEDAFKTRVRNMVKSQTPDEAMATLRAIDNRISEIKKLLAIS